MSFTLEVTAAMNESATKGSKEWWPPWASHWSSGNGCSVMDTPAKPASSARRATSARWPSPIHRS